VTAPITLDEMIGCVRREVNKRQFVYTRLVREGKMNRRVADREIDVMEAVLLKLRAERGDGPLFAE
jgi:hypothetical protein